MGEMQFTDRYQAMGIPYPNSATVCEGDCEGTGLVPIQEPAFGRYAPLWQAAHERGCVSLRNRVRELWRHREWWYWRSKLREWCDGWHFVTCPDCDGTGKRAEGGET